MPTKKNNKSVSSSKQLQLSNQVEGKGKLQANTSTKSRSKRSNKNSKSSKMQPPTSTLNNMVDLENEATRLKLSESLLWHILHSHDSGRTSYNSNSNSCDASNEEVEGIVDAVVESLLEQQQATASTVMTTTSLEACLIELLLDYVPDFENEQSTMIVTNVMNYILGKVDDYTATTLSASHEDSDSDDDNDNDTGMRGYYNDDENAVDYIDSDDDENYIQEGECELCERDNVRLTRHHLIPRSTWPRIKPRFQKAAPYFEEGDMEEVEQILSIGSMILTTPNLLSLHHFSSGAQIKQFLSCYTCNICSLCHGMVHKRFDNMELAETWNTVDKLLEDENIMKFCKWAHKQKPRRR